MAKTCLSTQKSSEGHRDHAHLQKEGETCLSHSLSHDHGPTWMGLTWPRVGLAGAMHSILMPKDSLVPSTTILSSSRNTRKGGHPPHDPISGDPHGGPRAPTPQRCWFFFLFVGNERRKRTEGGIAIDRGIVLRSFPLEWRTAGSRPWNHQCFAFFPFPQSRDRAPSDSFEVLHRTRVISHPVRPGESGESIVIHHVPSSSLRWILFDPHILGRLQALEPLSSIPDVCRWHGGTGL